ncbi:MULTISPECIES: ATPase domain-containing protein [unclassified Variovorax]|jgi:circadian clock protein KaiC|uniref:ATPase domain-containing protein n=1 Tax=unclassified Variovorax TaxID=663243 RepID=UPI0008698104|nr:MULTISPECIES: ATPase domain-containing protein [unclassified Variovorax]MBN8754553.1 circadian clock protein KaiC [Variovorax sp.]ODU19282.1 MAG: circadian clock protein KaiC [Variovorax sp. SCN 67-85]ODV25185.1 MAG: circadian clock protein KaiC [Variovorax sp. SCN 67-20]OJZ03004.1 MAG: circadian clock protein KaiC [Variovorax sp. 67-131]
MTNPLEPVIPRNVEPTGVPGLDDVTAGGLPGGHVYLVEGTPGAGKTTLGLQFLLQGRSLGQKGLYVTLSETSEELAQGAASHGWDLAGVEIFDLVSDDDLSAEAEQSILQPSDFELGETIRGVMALVEREKPSRVVFDSLSELRLLSQSSLRYRRQILALKRFFLKHGCTVLLLDDKSAASGDMHLHSIAHGVIQLEQNTGTYGPDKRRMRVVKLRGVSFREGEHDFTLTRGGLRVFTRLVANEHGRTHAQEPLSSGNPDLDRLLGGGLTPGTNLLFAGPAGVGKTTTAVSCVRASLQLGGKAAIFLFDEGTKTLLTRSRALGMGIDEYIANGQLTLNSVDPAEISAGQFSHHVRDAVERQGVTTVVIDTLNAYLVAMPGNNFLLLQMHELLTYLNLQGITTIVVLSQHGLTGETPNDVDLSYLSDSMLQFRYFEARGELLKAVSVVKSRTSAHATTIHQFRLGQGGLEIGEALTDFEGVMAGLPRYRGRTRLLGDADEA